MLNTQVGDIVEDCRGKLLKVEALYEQRALFRSIRSITSFLPWRFRNYINNLCGDHFTFLTYVYDKTLLLEDGSEASAISCCDLVCRVNLDSEFVKLNNTQETINRCKEYMASKGQVYTPLEVYYESN